MRAVNHALVGSSIATAIGNAWALPLAFASHFVLDAVPHFDDPAKMPLGSRPFWVAIIADGILVTMLIVFILLSSADSLMLIASGLLAVSPDAVHLNLVLRQKLLPEGPVYAFHRSLQWSETPYGMLVEAVVFFGASFYLIGAIYG